MVQLAWRFLRFREGSGLAGRYRARTADARGGTRKTTIVALARKLLIAFGASWLPARCRRASSCARRREGPTEDGFAARPRFPGGPPMTIRGGGDPSLPMASRPH